ncbi:MAG: protein-L-isoaspartate O-methyltransferase [Chromatiales bacterium 21-64-14]|nr:MAG: protein-L-isoaspartate O-methyltransferase [Chromatiales bacterium 21-64-14]HQU15278.1 protein-L-isoaspartate O-methyltransferase [Gammaproteobacteria bacterium]
MADFNIEQARFNMIEQQIRPWDVLDPRILDLVAALPREAFVPEAYRNLAFADLNIPLGHGQVMMAPKMEARMLQALDVGHTDSVLEVGTGSGYVTACLAALGGHVFSVEIVPELKYAAQKRLAERGIENVTLRVGDASAGWDPARRYDVIAVTGSLPMYTDVYQKRLSVGGRLFVIAGQAPIMEALLVTRTAPDGWTRESLFETDLPPLINAPAPACFEF